MRIFAILLGLFAAACGSDSTTSPTTTNTSTPVTESFEATLSRGESLFYSFTVGTAGNVSVTLASVVQQGRSAALSTPVRIGLGTPEGEGCTVTDSIQATPALSPQLTAAMTAGIHCIYLSDVGQVSGTVIAAVRFSHL